MQNWRILWHNNIKNIAKCSSIFCTAAVNKAHKILLLWAAGKNNACCTQAASLLLWRLLSDSLVLSTGQKHPKNFSTSPHHFPPLLYTQPFIPISVSWCWLCPCNCVLGSRLNPIAEMTKTEGTPFLRVLYTSDSCSSIVSSAAPSSNYQAVPGRESSSGWIGTSLVALPCRRLSFVELLLPDRGLSKELVCNKSEGSRGLAQWGLEEMVGQGEKNGKIGGNEGMKTQCIQTRLGMLSEWR